MVSALRGLALLGLVVGQGPARRLSYQKAQEHTRLGQWEAAISTWRSLLWSERDSTARALICQQLGYIALQRGDSNEALYLWEQSLRYRPTYAVALKNYQWLRMRLRRPPETPPPQLLRYVPYPPLSEDAPPGWGEGPLRLAEPSSRRWWAVRHLQE